MSLDGYLVWLADIQQRRIPSHGSRVVPLELWGPEGNVPCMVKFDVADVAYPVVSLGKMIETGFTFSFNDYKCYMHKGNRLVEIFRKGRIFVLRMRRKWLKGGMVAPIDGPSRCREIEMDVTEENTCVDPGTAAAEAAEAVRTRVDEPGDDPPPPQPREVRPCSTRPGAEAVRQHNLTHCPYQSWCEVCVASKDKSDHYHKEAPEQKDTDVARVQMDFTFVGAEGSFVDEPRAKSTVIMVICKDDGNLAATVVRTKTDEYGIELVLRFLNNYERVEIKTDGEPSIMEIARRVQSRRDRMTSLAQSSVGGHQEVGAVERANGAIQAQLRAYYLDVLDRMKVRIIPGALLFPWMLRHSAWTVVRYQSDQKTKQTPYERTRGSRYESALVPFGEVVMAKIADGDMFRAGKLDSTWVKAVWVGRVDKSNEHLLLTTKGCIRSRVVRRIPDGDQASYHDEVKGLPWDTLKGSAEMMRNATNKPGEPPRPSRGRPRKDGTPAQSRTATTTTTEQKSAAEDQVQGSMPGSSSDHLKQSSVDEQDVIERGVEMDAEPEGWQMENNVMDPQEENNVTDQQEKSNVMDQQEENNAMSQQMMNDAMDMAVDDPRRRRLKGKQFAQSSATPSKRLKREATIAAIKDEIFSAIPEERLDLEQAHNYYASIRTTRSTESIRASRMVEINKWKERGVIERWSRADAVASGGKVFQARWVDDLFKEKSRYVVKEFANTKDPTVFAAASDTAVGRVVEYKAVVQEYSMFTFDVTSAYTHAWEDELVFLEPHQEEIEEHGDCLLRSVRVIYGRRKGARSWQEHFDSVIRSEEARQRGFTVEAHPKCPTLYYIREADGLIELHVDDGHGCGKEEIIAELLTFLSEIIEIKYVQGIRRGSYEYLKTTKVRDERKLMSIPNKRYLQSALDKLGMSNCKGSVSP